MFLVLIQILDVSVKVEFKKVVDMVNEVVKVWVMVVIMQQLFMLVELVFLFNVGVMVEMFVESEIGEFLFVSIYVFQIEDKFVKFSIIFLVRISDLFV